jgi:DNA-binding response OmpR family regulator
MYVDSEALWRGTRMRRRILLVDDEVAVLLTLKAVLEISGFDVDTAASAREGVSKLHTREYQMLITDMRMEHDVAGVEVIKAARAAAYHPVVALLTAYPVADEDWQEMGADQLLVKPMHTRMLLQQIEDMIAAHDRRPAEMGVPVGSADSAQATAEKSGGATKGAQKKALVKSISVKSSAKGAKKTAAIKTVARKASKRKASKKSPGKKAAVKKAVTKSAAKGGGKPKPPVKKAKKAFRKRGR